MGDVASILNLIRGHIGALALLLTAMVAAIVFAAVKLKKPLKGFVQWQSVIAFVALTAFVVNTMLTGPLYNALSVAYSRTIKFSYHEAMTKVRWHNNTSPSKI